MDQVPEGFAAAATIGAIAALTGTLKPLITSGAKLIDDLLGEPLKIAGGMLADRMYISRLQQAAIMAGKAQLIMEKHGVKPTQLPTSFLIPFLDAASTSSSEEINDLFAELLVSAIQDDIYQHPIFRHAISQMNADEARILEYFGKGGTCKVYGVSTINAEGTNYRMEEFFDTSMFQLRAPQRIAVYFENLIRLGIVCPLGVGDAHSPIPPNVSSNPQFQKSVSTGNIVLAGDVAISEVGKLLAAMAAKCREDFTRPA